MRRSRLFLIIGSIAALMALAGLWQWRAHERDGSAALARGLAALDRGDARTARVELMNAIKGNPRSALARAAQARALADLGDGAGAQAEVERARSLGQAPAATRAVMAQAHFLQGDFAGALAEARAIDLPEEQALDAAHVIARAALAEGDVRGSETALTRALALNARDSDTWVEVGRLRMATGDQAGAIAAADQAVALDPKSALALGLRAELTRTQYGLVAALPWFDRAMAVDPDSVPVLEQYAATLADAGQASRMLAMTRRILALDPGNARAWMMQAVMAARAGQDDLARKLLERTGGRLDGEPATQLLRGILHLQDGNPLLAAQTLAPLVDAQPWNRPARILLGRAYADNGDQMSAAATLAPIVAQQDADPYVLTLAARVQESLGDRAMASDMLARAAWPVRPAASVFATSLPNGAPADPATARDNIPYIRALLTAGRDDEALERARLLNRANPGAPAAWLILGDVLQANGQGRESVRAYEAGANIRFDRDAALRLVSALQQTGNGPRAEQVARLFLRQHPMDHDMLRLAAGFAIAREDWRSAERLLQALRAQVGDNDALLMTDLARVSLEQRKQSAALAYARHGYALMPGNPVTADMLGWVLMRSDAKGPMAVDLLEKAVALAPSVPVLQMHLGQAYAAAGRKGEARLALNRAASVRDFGNRQEALEALKAL